MKQFFKRKKGRQINKLFVCLSFTFLFQKSCFTNCTVSVKFRNRLQFSFFNCFIMFTDCHLALPFLQSETKLRKYFFVFVFVFCFVSRFSFCGFISFSRIHFFERKISRGRVNLMWTKAETKIQIETSNTFFELIEKWNNTQC